MRVVSSPLSTQPAQSARLPAMVSMPWRPSVRTGRCMRAWRRARHRLRPHRAGVRRKLPVHHGSCRPAGIQIGPLLRLQRPSRMLGHGRRLLHIRKPGLRRRGPGDQRRRSCRRMISVSPYWPARRRWAYGLRQRTTLTWRLWNCRCSRLVSGWMRHLVGARDFARKRWWGVSRYVCFCGSQRRVLYDGRPCCRHRRMRHISG